MKYKVQGQILFSQIRKKTSAVLLISLCLEMPLLLKKRERKDGKVPRSQESNYKIVEHQDLCCACGSRSTWHDLKQHRKTIGATVKVELF